MGLLDDVPEVARQYQSGQRCPHCLSKRRKGVLEVKTGMYGEFLGCDRFPNCYFTVDMVSNIETQANKLLKKNKKTRRSRKKKGLWKTH